MKYILSIITGCLAAQPLNAQHTIKPGRTELNYSSVLKPSVKADGRYQVRKTHKKDTTFYFMPMNTMAITAIKALGKTKEQKEKEEFDKQAAMARANLLNMGCKQMWMKPDGFFCTNLDQFQKALEYLKMGYIKDVYGEMFSQSTFPIKEEPLQKSPNSSISGTHVIVLKKNNPSAGYVYGSSQVKLKFDIPVIGPAPGCSGPNALLTADEYNRKVFQQQNFILNYREYGFWKYTASKNDGVVEFNAKACDVDVLLAYKHAAENNLWNTTFTYNMVFKVGPTFIFGDPVCSLTGNKIDVAINPYILRPYYVLAVPVKVNAY